MYSAAAIVLGFLSVGGFQTAIVVESASVSRPVSDWVFVVAFALFSVAFAFAEPTITGAL